MTAPGENERVRRWLIVLASFVMMGLSFACGYLLTIYGEAMAAEFHASRARVWAGYSFFMLGGGLAAPAMGGIADRCGVRPVMLVGAGMMGVCLLLMSRINALWHMYILQGVIAGGLGLGATWAPMLANVRRWFDKPGLPTTLVYAGMGIGIMLVPALGRATVMEYGWRDACSKFAVLFWLIGIPLAIVIKDPPARLAARSPRSPPEPVHEPPSPALRKIEPMYLLLVIAFSGFYVTHTTTVFLAAHAMSLGLPPGQAGNLLGVVGLSSIAGRIAIGLVCDRIGASRVMVGGAITFFIAASSNSIATSYHGLLPSAALFGFSYGGMLPMYTVICGHFVAARRLARGIGGLNLACTLGAAGAGYCGGLIFDLSGSYTRAFGLAAALAAVHFLLCVILIRHPGASESTAAASEQHALQRTAPVPRPATEKANDRTAF